MFRLALAAAAALALASPSAATTAQDHYVSKHTPIPKHCTLEAFKPFSAAVWSYQRWEREKPSQKAVRAQRRRLICSQGYPGHHQGIQKTWHHDKWAFYAYRRYMLELVALTPYDCGTAGRFAIPCNIVACESGYSWSAYNPSGALGPYQLLGWGAPWPVNSEADKLAHHRIAGKLWDGGAGASNWVCA